MAFAMNHFEVQASFIQIYHNLPFCAIGHNKGTNGAQ